MTVSASELRAIIREENQRADGGTCLTRRQVADRLQVSVEKVRDLGRSGDLPETRIGTAVRYRVSDVLAYLDRRRS